MSSYEIYFNLLPSDLCAASNFRHLYFLVASCETLLSVTSAGLALALAIAMYTHQAFIELHTGSHPFIQASTFLFAGIAMIFRTIVLAGLTTAIILNDAEIFVACAEEEIDETARRTPPDERVDEWPFYDAEPDKKSTSTWCNVPGPYSCGTKERNSLYSSASRIAIVYRRYGANGKGHNDDDDDDERHNPTEKARKCFKRRQACLSRQRQTLAAFPIVQLLCGAISTAFWFSIDSDLAAHQSSTRDMLESQLPSLRLFDGYLALWAIGLLHSPFFLLVATWHYARVDWQMQLLAVHHVLSASAARPSSVSEPPQHAARVRLASGHERCPNCQERENKKHKKTIDGIRNSRHLRKAVAKAERKAEKKAMKEATDDGGVDGDEELLTLSRSSNVDVRREHRIAALSTLTGGTASDAGSSSSKYSSPRVRQGTIDVHRSQAPLSVPVSPTSLSFILGATTTMTTTAGDGPNGRQSLSGSVSAEEAPSVRIPCSYLIKLPTPVAATTGFDGQQRAKQDGTSSAASSRPVSTNGMPTKSAIKSTLRTTTSTNVKRVSFPAVLPATEVYAKERCSPADAGEKTRVDSPMTAISEESSGASTISSIIQVPAKAVLVPAPRSAPAEQVVSRKLM